MVTAKESEKLDKLSYKENEKKNELYRRDSIYNNLSIMTFFGGAVQTISSIINDLVEYGKREEDDVINIFYKDDRMFFMGAFFLLIALIIFIANMINPGQSVSSTTSGTVKADMSESTGSEGGGLLSTASMGLLGT